MSGSGCESNRQTDVRLIGRCQGKEEEVEEEEAMSGQGRLMGVRREARAHAWSYEKDEDKAE